MKKILTLIAVVTVSFSLTAQAAIILGDEFADVVDASKTGNTATFDSWDSVNGINAPASSLSFFVGDTTTPVGFHNASDGEIDVNNNMTAGGWDTSILLNLDGSTGSIGLTSLILDMRLTNGSGADNSTGSKSGRMAVELIGSSSGSLGTVDPGNSSYPSVEYVRTLDLTGLPALGTSESYTLVVKARGTGFGHHKSLQALELNGDITAIPEPGTIGLLALACSALLLFRRLTT